MVFDMTLPVFGKGRPRKLRPLVETTARIGARDIANASLTPSRASTSVRVAVDGVEMALDVVSVPRNYGGAQALFLCPACSRKCRHLYLRDDPRDGRRLACRQCSGLDYASRHVRRRGLHRVRDLRRRLGAPVNVLAPLPQRPRHVRRDYWRKSIARIVAAETLVARELHDMLVRARRRLRHERHRDRWARTA